MPTEKEYKLQLGKNIHNRKSNENRKKKNKTKSAQQKTKELCFLHGKQLYVM